MKNKVIELDVNFIGGEKPLAKEDEKAYSEYLKKEKLLRAKKFIHNISIHPRKNLRIDNDWH